MVSHLSALHRFGGDSLCLRAGLPCLSDHRLCAGAQHSRFPLAGTLSRPAGSTFEPWCCADGAGADRPTCSGRGITTSCSGNGSVRPAGRANQNRRHVTYRCARRPHLRSHWLANNTHKNETR